MPTIRPQYVILFKDEAERDQFREKATKRGMTMQAFMRKLLGLPFITEQRGRKKRKPRMVQAALFEGSETPARAADPSADRRVG